MTALYPPVEPRDTGFLNVGDGQQLYWETSGNPAGIPAVCLHGGPGSGSSPDTRRFFDPARYRIILYDQRGAGRSTPSAADLDTDLSLNTTGHLIADLQKLRDHFAIERCVMLGHSWGTTLALAYAERHPRHVLGLVLIGVTTTRRSEIDWLYRDLAPLFPAEWQRFCAGVSPGRRNSDLVAAYRDLLADPDAALRAQAALDWHAWDTLSTSTSTTAAPAAVPLPAAEARRRLARARIVTHYFHHAAWLEDGVLLRNAGNLAGIPGIMVQGRLDLQAPLKTAWELARAWPDGQLVIVENAGHATSDFGMNGAIVAATDRLAAVLG